jgi:putative transcriptional regulator
VDLGNKAAIGPNTMARLSKGQPVQMNVLGKICKELECNIGDIVDYIDDDAGGDIK